MGDKVTPEAYQNIARRLVHRGVLVANEDVRPIKYKGGQNIDGHWLEEEELAAWVSDEYPLLALPIWKESQRQLRDIPEEVWVLLREKLMAESARDLFQKAVVSYCDYFDALLREISETSALGADPRELSKQKAEARNGLLLLRGLAQYGLGLSVEAVGLPESVEQALEELGVSSGARAQSHGTKIDLGKNSLSESRMRSSSLRFKIALPTVGSSLRLMARREAESSHFWAKKLTFTSGTPR